MGPGFTADAATAVDAGREPNTDGGLPPSDTPEWRLDGGGAAANAPVRAMVALLLVVGRLPPGIPASGTAMLLKNGSRFKVDLST